MGRFDKTRAHYTKGHRHGGAHGAHRLVALLEKQGKTARPTPGTAKPPTRGHPGAKKAIGGNPDTVEE